MSWRYPLVLFLVCLPLLIFAPAASAAPLTVTCNGGTCSPDWYKIEHHGRLCLGSGTVSRSTSGCGTQTISSNVVRHSIVSVSYGGTPPTQATAAFDVRRDATPPTVTGASPTRGPDSNGWYNHPVGIDFNGKRRDIGSRWMQLTDLRWPDTASASFTGTCTDNAGNVSAPLRASVRFKYDATPPAVVSRSRVARTRTAGTTIRSTSMHPGATTSRASLRATPGRSAEAGRWPRAAPTMPATSGVPVASVNYDAARALHRQRHVRSSARQQRLVQPPRPRDVPRHRRRVRHRVVQRSVNYSGPDTIEHHRQRHLHGQGRQPSRRHVTVVQVRLDSTDHLERRVRLG